MDNVTPINAEATTPDIVLRRFVDEKDKVSAIVVVALFKDGTTDIGVSAIQLAELCFLKCIIDQRINAIIDPESPL